MAVDSLQRAAEREEILRRVMDAAGAAIWCSLPGVIVSFDAEAVTAQVQPTVRGVQRGADGSVKSAPMPVLPDVPVIFPRGGGATLTFPVKPGDECLVVFADRAIDAWWAHGGVQDPVEPRTHDLSDGFAILGPMSQVAKIGGISTSTVQLRSDDGAAFVELDPTTHDVNVQTTSTASVNAGTLATITAPVINLTGDVNIIGTLTVTETIEALVEIISSLMTTTTLAINGHDFTDHEHDHGTMTSTGHTGGVL